jgi:glycosyltransferase involved in cell wall biosynthesis
VNLAILIGRFPPGPPLGGAELQAEQWAQRLAKRHCVTLITRRLPRRLPRAERRDGYDIVRVDVPRVPLLRTLADRSATTNAVRALTPPPDVLLCFQTFISGWIGVDIQRRLGIPSVVWIRGEGEYRLAASRRARMGLAVWRQARGVLVQSRENRRALMAEVAAADPALARVLEAKLEVVPNGLVLPPVSDVPGTGVLAVGRLIADKGWDVLLDALAGLGTPVTFAGEGPERAALEARARECRVPARFVGFVDRARLDALYAQAGCVVLASRMGEGLPNVLLEAMAHARPVVVTPVAGVAGLVVDDENGLVVPVGDVMALSVAVTRLLSDAALARRIGRAGRDTAEAFAWEGVEPPLEAALARWVRA